ncbi:MAG: chemotaxis protein CheB [Steroidobacteraceae bacterium]
MVTQHIPAGFSRAFATRLDAALPFKVQEAEDGTAIQREQVYIAPGGRHFSIERQADAYVCRVAWRRR